MAVEEYMFQFRLLTGAFKPVFRVLWSSISRHLTAGFFGSTFESVML